MKKIDRQKLLVCFLLSVLVAVMSSCVAPAQQQDLFSNAVSSRLTADAAMNQAEIQEQFLTATAEAPIIRITETAAGLSVQSTQAAATSMAGITTQNASSSQTAAAWTPTANATQTKAFAVLDAEQKAILNNSERDKLELERQQNNNAFWAAMGQMVPFLALVLLAGGVVLGFMLITRNMRYQPVKVDARGNVIPILDTVEGTVTDPDSMPNYRGNLKDALMKELLHYLLQKKFGMPNELPQITAPRQDAAKERDQMIDLATRGLLPDTNAEARSRKKEVGQEAMKQLTAASLDSRFQVLNDPSGLSVLDGEVIQTLDQDWTKGKSK